ncbi:MAG: Fe-S cluster assembly sulfur transfer protein SufU, partial [Gemmatimonadota bacterium]
ILDHYRSPKNKREMEEATHSVTMDNPLCGDVIELNLRIEDDRIEDVSFQGQGCSISQASASMLTRELEGRSVRDARVLDEKFTKLMHGDEEYEDDPELGELRALSGVSKFPVRVKCALLGFNCLEELVGEGDGDEEA